MIRIGVYSYGECKYDQIYPLQRTLESHTQSHEFRPFYLSSEDLQRTMMMRGAINWVDNSCNPTVLLSAAPLLRATASRFGDGSGAKENPLNHRNNTFQSSRQLSCQVGNEFQSPWQLITRTSAHESAA